MPNLSPTQINNIAKTVEKSGISFSHLADDLTDHICCEVESLMQHGLKYRKACETVFQTVNREKLKEIESLTILFTNKKRLIMKKSMYVLSIISVSIALISFVFKINHLPGANVLFTLGMLCVIFGIIPLMFFSKEKTAEKEENKFLSLKITGFVASISMVTEFVFLLMHWPGGSLLFFISIITLLIFLVFYITANIRYFKNKTLHLGIAILIFVYIIVNSLVYVSRRSNILIFYNYTDLWMKESLEYFNNKKVYGPKTEDAEKVVKKTDEMVLFLEKIKDNIVPGYRQNNLSTSYLSGLTKYGPEDPEQNNIRQRFDEYREFLLNLNISEDLKNYISATFDTKDKKTENSVTVYQNNLYIFNSRIGVYNNISRLEKDMRIIESEVIQQLNDQVVTAKE